MNRADAGKAGNEAWSAAARRKRREFIADVRFLLWTGETDMETIARRMNTNADALAGRLTRADRADLLRRMTCRTEALKRKAG